MARAESSMNERRPRPDESSTREVDCRCGATLRLVFDASDNRGGRVLCPACGALHEVPGRVTRFLRFEEGSWVDLMIPR
jgi:hypothetical protein